MPAAPVLAHYGGVPEALTIVVPLLIFGGFLLLEKRARRKERERGAGELPARVERPARVDDGRAAPRDGVRDQQPDEQREAP